MRYDRNVVAGTKQINAELEKIQNSIDTMLDREGTAPNELLSSIDMNNFRIYNLADPASELDAVNKKYVDQLLAGTNIQGVVPIVLGRQTGDGVSTDYTIVNNGSSASSFFVFLDGVAQKAGTDYTVSGTTLSFTEAPENGVSVDITYFEPAVLADIPSIVGGVTTYVFDTVADAKLGITVGGVAVSLKVNDTLRIVERGYATFKAIAYEGGNLGYDRIDDDTGDLTFVLSIHSDIDAAAFGVIYGDSSDQSAAIQAANTACSNLGYYLTISGEVKCNVAFLNEHVRIKGSGKLVAFDRKNQTLKATSDFGTAYAVSAIVTDSGTIGGRSDATVSKITAAGNDFEVGDIIKIVSEDVIPTTVLTEGCRNGEWGNVLQVSGDDVWINQVLEQTYTTTPRVAKIQEWELDLDLAIESTTGNVDNNSALVLLRGFKNPRIILHMKENDGPGLALHSTYKAVGTLYVENLTNDTTTAKYGYGLIEAGTFLSNFTIYQTGFCRHVYTTGVASKTDTAIYTYGEPISSKIRGSADGATSNAWDTHSQGKDITFEDITCENVQSMVQSRSRGTRVIGLRGNSALYMCQCRNPNTNTQAELELIDFKVTGVKKTFNIKDDSVGTNPPRVIIRGDNYADYEPTAASAAFDSEGNVSIYGTCRFNMTGGTDQNYIAQTGGNIDIYGGILFESLNAAVTKPFRLNDCQFTIRSETGGWVKIASAGIGKLFTAVDATAASTTEIRANSIETNQNIAITDRFEFSFAKEQLTLRSSVSQTNQSSFQFISTSGGAIDLEFDSLDPVIYLQFTTNAGSDTVTSIRDGNFPGQKVFIDNAAGSTLNIPNSLSNVEYTKSIPVNNTDELTWRGTYWA